MKRKRLSKKRDGKYFSRTAKKVKAKNTVMTMRGGRRL